MLINIIDAAGVTQTVVVSGQEAVVDHSSSIVATSVAQTLLEANSLRSGMAFQNVGSSAMYLSEVGAASAADGKSFVVPPLGLFPPSGFPVTTGAWSIVGTASDKFVCREW